MPSRPRRSPPSRRFAAALPFVVLLGGLSGLSSAPVAAEPVLVPGTTVSLDPPEGFALSDDFSGIADAERGATVHVVELPAPLEELTSQMTAENLEAQGLELLDSETVEAGIPNATLLHVSQEAQGMTFEKWLLVGGEDGAVALLTATVPEALWDDVGGTLRETLLGATRDPGREIDPLEGIDFLVTGSGGLEIARSIMGSALLLTEGGALETESPEAPFLVVARSLHDVPVGDIAEYAEMRLGQTAGVEALDIESGEPLEVAGMPAYEIVATAEAEGTTPVVLYQLIAHDEEHYYLTQGRVGADTREPWLTRFGEVARSLSLADRE